jgi:hypothetical protein
MGSSPGGGGARSCARLAVSFPENAEWDKACERQTARTQPANIVTAVELSYLDVCTYPIAEQGLKALLFALPQSARWKVPYRRSLTVPDPTNR